MSQPVIKRSTRVLLLENIHPLALEAFKNEGYDVETLPGALTPSQLKEKIQGFQVLGIRSKTQIPAEVFETARDLITVGCFCIGTNQVDLEAARNTGTAVFNAPFGNTRSVAELVISEIVMLSRKLGQKNNEMHQKIWKKSSDQCFEVRGKTLGIIGYGNIGAQVSTLAESLGMRIIYFDIVSKLPLGNARSCNSLKELLQESDFVTLHVPETPQTQQMINTAQLQSMKAGSYLINASRGTVVDIPALSQALKSGHLRGAALDVFPEEPNNNNEKFAIELQNIPNVILTPHIGGATEEAQANIGTEVPAALIRFLNSGSTSTAVNFPKVDLPPTQEGHRILNVHRNVPGVLREINRIISEHGTNIQAQTLLTEGDLGYMILDTDKPLSHQGKAAIESLKTSIKTRTLY